jgi:hypothetical protein
LKELTKFLKKKKQEVKQDTELKNKIYNRKLFFRLVIVLIDFFFQKPMKQKIKSNVPSFLGNLIFFLAIYRFFFNFYILKNKIKTAKHQQKMNLWPPKVYFIFEKQKCFLEKCNFCQFIFVESFLYLEKPNQNRQKFSSYLFKKSSWQFKSLKK